MARTGLFREGLFRNGLFLNGLFLETALSQASCIAFRLFPKKRLFPKEKLCLKKNLFAKKWLSLRPAVSQPNPGSQESTLQFTLSSPSTPYWCRHCFSVSTDTVVPVSASNRA